MIADYYSSIMTTYSSCFTYLIINDKTILFQCIEVANSHLQCCFHYNSMIHKIGSKDIEFKLSEN